MWAYQVFLNIRIIAMNVKNRGETFPFSVRLVLWKRAWQNHRRRRQRRTSLRKNLTWRVAVARVMETEEKATEGEASRRVQNTWMKEREIERKDEGDRNREGKRHREGDRKQGMSFLLKKSCPNKGTLFHAQCTPPQTRSLRYLSLRGVRCFTALLSSHFFFLCLRRSLSLLLFPSPKPSGMACRSLWVYAFLPAKFPWDVIAANCDIACPWIAQQFFNFNSTFPWIIRLNQADVFLDSSL